MPACSPSRPFAHPCARLLAVGVLQFVMPTPLAQGWLVAADRAEVRAALEGLYARVSAEVAARGPACWASGRCCHFERAGHRLYTTGLEAAYTLVGGMDAGGGAAEGGEGGAGITIEGRALGGAGTRIGAVGLTAGAIADARAAGTCPFQRGNLCGVHATKPMACRVYFCDRSAQAWQQDLSERLLSELRALHDRFGIEYRYGEWRGLLEEFV
jgi:Fe-S-cluster containining protein